jgi:hypothetical protein
MEVRNGSTWGPANSGQVYNNMGISGVEGNIQNSSLADDQAIIGGDTFVDWGTTLWNGTNTQGGLDPSVTDPVGALPFLAILCPAPHSTMGGSVVMNVNAFASAGVASVTYYVDQNSVCTLTSPPYTCTWDSTQASAGSHDVQVWVYDTHNRSTSAYFSFNVDQSAPATCSDDPGLWWTPNSDAGTSPPTDAGAPEDDAGAPGDADTPEEGGPLASDGGVPTPDGSTPAPDAAATEDAAVAQDAATGAPSSASDAGDADLATSPGGCSCRLLGAPTPPTPGWAVVALAVLAARARTSSRRRGRPNA